jgi:hypothetical protein
MTKFELSWKSEKYQNNSIVKENINALCFEDVADEWFKRLADIGLSENDCWWKIISVVTNHVCVEMNPGMKCVVRGW